jgi:PAS domain S-box-containing protein
MRILVIENDKLTAEELIAALGNQNYTIEVAADGNAGWSLAEAFAYDLIVLDESLPKLDGIRLCQRLRSHGNQTPILLLTTRSSSQDKAIGWNAGADDYLIKPVDPEEVAVRVQALLRRNQATAQSVLQQGNLRPQADLVGAKIMVASDNPQLQATVRTLLQPWGLRVISLDFPDQFWQTLDAVAPNLLLLDIQMSEIGGIELCQTVRNKAHWNCLPIVVITDRTDADTISQVFTAGADDFISQPIVGPELVTRTINHLERIKLLNHLATLHQPEVAKQQNSETALRKVKDELEMRVAERTAELVSVNERLRSELNERKQIEDALRVSQVRFAGILDIADDAIISVDGKQQITLFNQGAEKIFGYTVQEAIGQPLDLLLPVCFAELHRQHVAGFGQSSDEARKMGERREIFGRRKNGEEFPAEASISKLQLKGETIFTVILRDTSDRKVIERMKDEFISIVSHELRTPLTSIHGSLGMLASGLLDAEPATGKRLLEIAVDSTERLIRLINDVLDVERIESGKVTMDKRTCNVADLMTNAVNVMQTMAEKFEVTLAILPLSASVWADSDRIIQTLTNLLSNAIKFSPAGATVWLSATQQGDRVLFQVKDQGRGIPADKLETIFERFQQVDASDSRNQDGTGLGLAICRNIIQQHGGRIWVESALGEGSTFYFTLPVESKTETSS